MQYSAECILTDEKEPENLEVLLCSCACSSFGCLAAKDLQVTCRLTTNVCVFSCCYSFQSRVNLKRAENEDV